MRLLTNSMKRDYPELCEWSDVLKEPTKEDKEKDCYNVRS